jgi:hypothetical protein
MPTQKNGSIFIALLIVIIIILFWNNLCYIVQDNAVDINVEWPSDVEKSHIEKLMFRASATIPMVNQPDLLFVGGERGQSYDLIWQYDAKYKIMKVLHKIPKPIGEQTTAAAVGQLRKDVDDISLVVARTSGLEEFRMSDHFSVGTRIWHQTNEKAIISSVSLGDIDRSGNTAIYLATFPKFEHFQLFKFAEYDGMPKNVLLLNKSGEWIDHAEEYGCAGNRNTWTAAFVDLTGDGFPDIVEATDEGECRVYINTPGATPMFKQKNIPMPNGFWMGMAVGDFDNSGRQSMYFSNSGGSIPLMLLNRMGFDSSTAPPITNKHCILYNKGNYEFGVHLGDDINKLPIMSRVGFGWGPMASDLDATGKIDIVMGQNWSALPHHKYALTRNPGAVFMQKKDGFKMTRRFKNTGLCHTVLIADVTNNGIPEIIWINHLEKPIVYRNNLSKPNSYRTSVVLPKTMLYANATLTANYASGHKLSYQNILGGTGIGSSRPSCFDFGWPAGDTIVNITIPKSKDSYMVITNPERGKKYNQTHFVKMLYSKPPKAFKSLEL